VTVLEGVKFNAKGSKGSEDLSGVKAAGVADRMFDWIARRISLRC
jgi:hypothetical protein